MEKIYIKNSEVNKSEILIENDLSKNIDDFLDINKCFFITNSTIAKLYPEILYKFNDKKIIIIKDGEKYKNYKTCNYILNKLLEEKIERNDCIVAFGGGVVGDIAGYCTSVILRGVKFIQIPTTLLAMCDSSIGGKTGYNTSFGKNLIGTFYLADKVLIDPMFLNTLDDYNYKCGLGEVLKYAFIEKSCKCEKFYNLEDILTVNQTKDVKNEMVKIIACCVSLKANVVSLDKSENNLRKILNFGHTFAHAFETYLKYKKISHGEAVSYGIKCASKLSYEMKKIDDNYYNKINFLIDKFSLTNKKLKFKKQKILELMMYDKKVQNKKINLLLPVAPLEVELFDNIDLLLLEASLP